MAKKTVKVEPVSELYPAISHGAEIVDKTFDWNSFWVSIGADLSKKHPKSYFWKLLKEDMAKKTTRKDREDLFLDNSTVDEVIYEDDDYKGIYTNYPAPVQRVAKLYFLVFQIEPLQIPSQYENKTLFGQWVKELGQIDGVAGEFLVDGLVRAKRNYDERHNKGFELDHPSTILKIFKSAIGEVRAEREMLFTPPLEKKEKTSKKNLRELRRAI